MEWRRKSGRDYDGHRGYGRSDRSKNRPGNKPRPKAAKLSNEEKDQRDMAYLRYLEVVAPDLFKVSKDMQQETFRDYMIAGKHSQQAHDVYLQFRQLCDKAEEGKGKWSTGRYDIEAALKFQSTTPAAIRGPSGHQGAPQSDSNWSGERSDTASWRAGSADAPGWQGGSSDSSNWRGGTSDSANWREGSSGGGNWCDEAGDSQNPAWWNMKIPDSNTQDADQTREEPPSTVAQDKGPQLKYKWQWPRPNKTGTFFINKLYLDKEKTELWEPNHLNSTELVSLEDLLQVPGVEKAFILNSCGPRGILPQLSLLPHTAHISLACVAFKFEEGIQVKYDVTICTKEEHIEYGDGVAVDSTCECDNKHKLQMIHPHYSMDLRANVVLLRSASVLRLIVMSCPLTIFQMERLAQFGWYMDFPVQPDKQLQEGESCHQVESALRVLLRQIEIDPEPFCAGVNFKALSDLFKLVVRVKGMTKEERNLYGSELLVRNKASPIWPKNNSSKVQVQMYNVGGIDGVEVLSHICHLKQNIWQVPPVDYFQLLYPSQNLVEDTFGKESEEFKFINHKIFKYQDNFCWSYLCNGDDRRIVPHANIYRQSFVAPGEEQYELGWLMTGSHCINPLAFDFNARFHKSNRIDVSIAVIPSFTDLDTEVHIDCMDLKSIGLHFHKFVPYEKNEAPFIAHNVKDFKADKICHVLGYVKGKWYGKRQLYEVQELSEPELAHVFEKFPSDCRKVQGLGIAMLHEETWQFCGIKDPLNINIAIDFYGRLSESTIKKAPSKPGMKPPKPQFKVCKVVQVFRNKDELYRTFKVTPQPPKPSQKPSDSKPKATESQPKEVDKKKKKTYEEAVKELGLKTDQEEEDYWNERWNENWSMDPWGILPLPDYDVEKEFPLTPWKMADDMVWLEKHVSKICKGNIPKLVGPYTLSLLKKLEPAHRQEHFIGLDKMKTNKNETVPKTMEKEEKENVPEKMETGEKENVPEKMETDEKETVSEKLVVEDKENVPVAVMKESTAVC